MKSIIKYGLAFLAGAALGAGGGYLYFKNRSEKVIESEVQKFKQEWKHAAEEALANKTATIKQPTVHSSEADKLTESAKKAVEAVRARNKAPITDYSKLYMSHSDQELTIEEYLDKSGIIVDVPKNDPRVITAIEFQEDEGYEKFNYMLFADGILADEENEIIDYEEEGSLDYIDPDILYGFQVQEEMDELYYRNPDLKRDYEILKSARFYNEG